MIEFIEKWGLFEASFKGHDSGNPFQEVELKAVFQKEEACIEVEGFYDGEGIYKIRFMPQNLGKWQFKTISNKADLDNQTGEFECIEPSENNHGPVKVSNTFHFEYADGTPHYSFGTTCYAWTHQTKELQEKTLETLKAGPFNKMRMCVFPKHYDYNHNEPELYLYEGSQAKGFDYTTFNPKFFRHLEKRISELEALGIECDLILFHPYDRWGFSKMGKENDDNYLKYIISRLAAFRNIWWSLANEYDIANDLDMKEADDWERFAQIVEEKDVYNHLRSIHNCLKFYDYNKPWITHCSIQRLDVFKTTENTDEWRNQYKKPIVNDECAYEGNINHGWGNITGQEMTRRFWEGVVRGGYVGHGETYVHPKDILWWSHGGELHGTSPIRIGFLRSVVEDIGGILTPVPKPKTGLNIYWDVTVATTDEGCYLFYFGFNQPTFRIFEMAEDKKYKVDLIDTWEMTIKKLEGTYSGTFRIDMPGKQYMAIRIKNIF